MGDSLSALSSDIASLVARADPRLVAIRGNDGTVASGLIWRAGLVVSAHEALGGEEEYTLTFSDGSSTTAQLAGRDPSTDVVLLKAGTAPFDDWDEAPTPKPGSLAVLVGRGDYSVRASLATVSEVGPAWRSLRGGMIDARITLDARLSGQIEGGAIIAPDGTLIGLAAAAPRRRAIAIPASTVARAVALLADKGYVPRGYLGVSLHPVGSGGGAIIVGLEAEGPAQQAGFLIGDIITTWAGEPVPTVGGVSNRLSAETVGKTIKLGVLRGGSPIDVDVTVGERPRA
jgi:S1-C subfamily serine protease